VTRAGERLRPLHVLIAMSSFPLLHNFKWGQISVLVTCALFGAWWCLERGRRIPAALLLALATSLKFYPAWFAIVPLARRDWRTLGWYALFCAAFLALVPALFLGPGAALRFYQGIAIELRAASTMALDRNSQSLDGVLGRLCYSVDSPFKPTADLITPIRWIVVPLSLVAAWWSLRSTHEAGVGTLLILFCVLPFVTPSSWPHYFVYLPAATLYLFSEARDRGAWRWPIVVLAALAAILKSLPCWQLFGSWQTYSALGMLFWANALTLFALLATVAAARGLASSGRRRSGRVGGRVPEVAEQDREIGRRHGAVAVEVGAGIVCADLGVHDRHIRAVYFQIAILVEARRFGPDGQQNAVGVDPSRSARTQTAARDGDLHHPVQVGHQGNVAGRGVRNSARLNGGQTDPGTVAQVRPHGALGPRVPTRVPDDYDQHRVTGGADHDPRRHERMRRIRDSRADRSRHEGAEKECQTDDETGLHRVITTWHRPSAPPARTRTK
jgi:hypothetical protein